MNGDTGTIGSGKIRGGVLASPLFGVPKNVLWTRSLYKSVRVEMAKCKAPLLDFWGPRNFRTAELYSQKGCLKKIKTLMLRRFF